MTHTPKTPPGGTRRLSDYQPGETAEIVVVDGDASRRLRLLEMGLTPGTEVELVRRAPLGDPLQIVVRGYHLAVSRENAACLFCK